MKHLLCRMILFTSFISTLPLAAVVPLIVPRSQSEDSARELVGLTHQVNLYDQERVYGSWAFTLEYTRSFRPKDTALALFGSDLTVNAPKPFVTISGSQVPNRGATDWLADYFGLPPDFKSSFTVEPRVENILLDINFYLGLDDWLDGLYFRVHAPICYSRWSLNFQETIITNGVAGYAPGYFNGAAGGVPRAQLLNSFTAFASGNVPNLIDPAVNPAPLVTFDSLQNAKFPTKRSSLTRLSDLQAALGWNFLQGEDHHFGLNIRMAAPTGNRPDAEFLFAPIVGNSHHWELGLGVTAHYLLWENGCSTTSFGFYLDGNVTHLFGTRQERTFDLVEKPLSRYMLVERLGTPVTNLYSNTAAATARDSAIPSSQFQNFFTPLANLTTQRVNVSVAAQADITALLNCTHNCFSLDIGYNFWGRTCEKIRLNSACPLPFNSNSTSGLYALKGDAMVYGFVANNAVNLPAGVTQNQPITLSATENAADIHAGTNGGSTLNPNIDNAQFAMVFTSAPSQQIMRTPNTPADTVNVVNQQRTSNNPLFIKTSDIDVEGAETKGLSNKIFGHLSYTWDSSCREWVPYLGLGGFVEYAHHNETSCNNAVEDNSCLSVALSQWGVWLKGGVSF